MTRILDPNVYFNLVDNSLLAPIMMNNGACIIGAFAGGKAFVPTVVDQSNFNLYTKTDGKLYAPYAVKYYTRNSINSPVAIRVLWNEAYAKTYYAIMNDTDVLYILASNDNDTAKPVSVELKTDDKDIVLITYAGSITKLYAIKLTAANNLLSSLGTDPTSSNNVYVVYTNPTLINSEYDKIDNVISTKVFSKTGDYSNSTTPIITDAAGNNLFSFATLSDGMYANTQVKVMIQNINLGTLTQYFTFDVVVRSFNDTNELPAILLTFNRVNLDITSPRYIGRVIGDLDIFYNASFKDLDSTGDFKNNSNYIRVITSELVNKNQVSPKAYPCKYTINTLPVPVDMTGIKTDKFFNTSVYDASISNNNSNKVFGFDYSEKTNHILFNEFPTTSQAYATISFNLLDCTKNVDNDAIAITDLFARFLVPFYGGSNGINPSTDFSDGINGFDVTLNTSAGTVQLDKALDLIANKLAVNLDAICVPGLSLFRELGTVGSAYLINKINNICKNRQDCFAIFDADDDSIDLTSLNSITTLAKKYDSSYAAAYFPYIQVLDPTIDKYVWLPASVGAISAIAFNDKIGYSWFAPAGFNRGGLDFVTRIKFRLNQQNRALLYNNKINPIANFPNLGPVIWGQKTLQTKLSALDRINVRRLVITIKKYVDRVGTQLLFEPNTAVLWDRFLMQVRPYLQSIVELQGLYAFEVQMDSQTNTPDLIDRNILKGVIAIQPTKAAEYIIIDFNINPTSAE